MHASELAAELDEPGARHLLTQGSLLRLAYNGSDGTPRVIPIGFFWNGAQVVVCTVPASPKVRAIVDRPDVAGTIDDGASPADAKSLLFRGPASVEIVDGVPSEYLDAARKTLDAPMQDEVERSVRATYEQMAKITITPTWARYYDFGGGRLPSVLQQTISEAQARQG